MNYPSTFNLQDLLLPYSNFNAFLNGLSKDTISRHNANREVNSKINNENGLSKDGIDDNSGKIPEYITQVITALNVLNIQLLSCHVKTNTASSSEVLFVIDINDFLDEKFLSIYSVTNRIQKNSCTAGYFISLSFTYDDGNLATSTLEENGFITTHTTLNEKDACSA